MGNQELRSKDLIAAWSGIRPLVKDPKKAGDSTASLSRTHVVDVSDSDLITIAGGKWTTYRRMAQDTVDALLQTKPELGEDGFVKECQTHGMQLIGADRAGIVCAQKFDQIRITLKEEYQLPTDIAKHLTHNYGTRALQIAEIFKGGFLDVKPMEMRKIVNKYPFLEAEVVFAVKQEYALTAIDVLCRRTRLGFLDTVSAREAAPRVVTLMGKLLGWSTKKQKEELADTLRYLDTMNI